jgi:hypothetical protein
MAITEAFSSLFGWSMVIGVWFGAPLRGGSV